MTNHSIIITGGGRGIGAAIAKLAAAEGYRVCFSYLNTTCGWFPTTQPTRPEHSSTSRVGFKKGSGAELAN